MRFKLLSVSDCAVSVVDTDSYALMIVCTVPIPSKSLVCFAEQAMLTHSPEEWAEAWASRICNALNEQEQRRTPARTGPDEPKR